MAHVAVVDGGQPYVLPLAYARDGDRVLLHGSTGSRVFRLLASGAPACLTVTLLDGLVLARTAFETSMHYRSAMVLGCCEPVAAVAVEAALRNFTDKVTPGRWNQLRPPNRRELAATVVLELALSEWSVKVSAQPPEDDEEDLDWPVWAGVVPLIASWGTPVPAPDLRGNHPPPDY